MLDTLVKIRTGLRINIPGPRPREWSARRHRGRTASRSTAYLERLHRSLQRRVPVSSHARCQGRLTFKQSPPSNECLGLPLGWRTARGWMSLTDLQTLPPVPPPPTPADLSSLEAAPETLTFPTTLFCESALHRCLLLFSHLLFFIYNSPLFLLKIFGKNF